MRRFLRPAILLIVLLLLAGHYYLRYAPRERAAAPSPGSLPARLLASDSYGACLWVPYPHQNLGELEGAIEDGPAYLAAAAQIAELPAPVLPSFGPFAVPPSSEIVACSDLGGERFLLVARVYPTLGAVARLAGRLADNPWLKGGEIRETRGRRDEVQEKVLHVAWIDGYWTVRSGDEAVVPARAASPLYPPNLGILHLGKDVSDFPAGDYLLQRKGEDLELSLAGGGPIPGPPVPLDGPEAPALLAVAGMAWPADAEKPLPPTAMALYDTKGGLHLGPMGDLPGVVMFNVPGEKRWGLPAKGLAGILTDNLPSGNAAGWSLVALDDESYRRAEALAPRISTLVPPSGDGPGARVVLGVWLEPGPALRRISQFRHGLQAVPLIPRKQVERWQDWETLLAPLTACRQVSLVATQSPAAFLLRLHDCG